MTLRRKLFYNKFHVTLFLTGRGMTIVVNVFQYCTLILLSGGTMQATLTGKRENKRGNGLELTCKVTIKAAFFICSKHVQR